MNPSTNVTEIHFKDIEHDTQFNSLVTVSLLFLSSNCHGFFHADLRRREGRKRTLCLLLINGSKIIYGKHKLRCHFQYYQQKYEMQGILAEWQLSKIRRIFKRKALKISPTQFMTPSYLRVKWEKVAFLVCNKRFLF